MGRQGVNLMFKKYDRLKVIGFAGRDKNRRFLWKCKCKCGTIKIIPSRHLISGDTKSCGCYIKEIRGKTSITHGETKNKKPSKEWKI